MLALTSHLRPAPYQYGILTLSLLGKLGGKNRRFLQEPMDVTQSKENDLDSRFDLNCRWDSLPTFKLMLPIQRAALVLEHMSILECSSCHRESTNAHGLQNLLSEDLQVEKFNLSEYKNKTLNESRRDQSLSALVIVRAALSSILEKGNFVRLTEKKFKEGKDISLRLFIQQNRPSGTKTMKLICRGLFHASTISSTQEQGLLLLHGLSFQMIQTVANAREDVRRSHNDEDSMKGQKHEKRNSSMQHAHVAGGKLQPLLPFGCFSFVGQLKTRQYCLVLNETIPEVLKSRNDEEVKLALEIMRKIVNCSKAFDEEVSNNSNETAKAKSPSHLSCSEIFVENMLYHLCHTCLASEWQERGGIFDGIIYLMQLMGKEWSIQYEVELIHVAIFCIKDQPQEVANAEKEALLFFFQVISSLYISLSNHECHQRFCDHVSVPRHIDDTSDGNIEKRVLTDKPVSETVFLMMIGEFGSPNPAVR